MNKLNPYQIAKKKEQKKVVITQILVFVLFIIFWELAARFNLINDFLFSSPSQIIKVIINYFKISL